VEPNLLFYFPWSLRKQGIFFFISLRALINQKKYFVSVVHFSSYFMKMVTPLLHIIKPLGFLPILVQLVQFIHSSFIYLPKLKENFIYLSFFGSSLINNLLRFHTHLRKKNDNESIDICQVALISFCHFAFYGHIVFLILWYSLASPRNALVFFFAMERCSVVLCPNVNPFNL